VNERTHLDLFSGIGGFALAAKWNGFRTVGFCDNEPYAQAVLKKHWPDVPCHKDIKELRGEPHAGVTLLTGGFPCQPFSCAGKQRGKKDDRYLWPEMLRVIREAQPRWIIGENVAGIVNMALDQVHTDLEAEGYEVESIIIPACGVDAPHRRNRVWIVANAKSGGGEEGYQTRSARKGHRVAISYLKTRVDYLENYAPKMWPTATQNGNYNKKGISKKSGNGLATTAKLWPTPRASEYKDTGPVGSKSHTHMNDRDYLCAKAKDPSRPSGCLSPMWTEWLMGYPIGWGELEVSEMPSSRKSRQKSSDASSR